MRSIGMRKLIGYGAFAVAFVLSLFVWMKWRPDAGIQKHARATVAQIPLNSIANHEQGPADASTVTEKLTQAKKLQLATAYGRFPLSFEANQGQTDSRVKFLSRGSGYCLFLTPTEAVMTLRSSSRESQARGQKAEAGHLDLLSWRTAANGFLQKRSGADLRDKPAIQETVLRMKLVGANPAPKMSGTNELPGKSNYFMDSDPKKWRKNVPTYARVKYQRVYAGVDLVYHGTHGKLEYDFVVAPGADPGVIGLRFEGAERLEIDAQGNLVLRTAAGELRQHKPAVYQEVADARYVVPGSYALRGRYEAGFEIGPYDPSQPLIIDPVLSYSTYLGGVGGDLGYGIAVDAAGNAYVTGSTESSNFPTTTGAHRTNFQGGVADAFVAKLNPTGTALLYSTFLGGSGYDEGYGIAVDAAGNAYVTGYTDSTNFPTTTGAFQATYGVGGFADAFVTKLSPTGNGLIYSTYLGGDNLDEGNGIAVDAAGNAYVTGDANSANFPTTPGSFQTALGGGTCFGGPCSDAFVTKLNPTGTALLYSTFLGGRGNEGGFDSGGIAVDAAGNAYVTGATRSANFPTVSAFQTIYGGGTCGVPPNTFPCGDAFVTKLNPAGSALVYSTYLGGSAEDDSRGIAVDAAGNAYVTGTTFSTDFPTTPNAFQTTFGGYDDAFVTKFNPNGTALTYSTYLGGSSLDEGFGIAVDSVGNVYATGRTQSADFPTTPGAPKAENWGGNYDAFVTKLNPTGTAPLVYSTYLGGSGWEGGDLYPGGAIALDATGGAYVTGMTTGNFPTTPGAFQTFFAGGSDFNFFDVFVSKVVEQNVDLGVTLTPSSLAFGNQVVNTTSATTTVTLANTGTTPVNITSIAKAGADAAQFNLLGSPSGGLTCLTGASSLPAGMSCTFGVSFAPTATGAKSASIVVTSDAAGSPHSIPVSGTGTEPTISLTATQTSAIVARGGTATFPLTVGQAGALASAIAFSCSGLPAGWSCGFNPATVPAGSGPTQVTLTVQAGTATGLSLPRAPVGGPGMAWATLLATLALLTLAVLSSERVSKTAYLRPGFAVGFTVLLLLLTGCSSTSSQPTQPQAFTVNFTVNATSGTTTTSMPLSITVR
jgi:hypothetical protein